MRYTEFKEQATSSGNLAAGSVTAGVGTAKIVKSVVSKWLANQSTQGIKSILKGVPFLGLIVGLYSAYVRHETKPNDLFGMVLDIGSGIGGLLTSVAMMGPIAVRDCYMDVVTDGKRTAPNHPWLALTGDLEHDMIANPKLSLSVQKAIAEELQSQFKEFFNQTAQRARDAETSSRVNPASQARASAISPDAEQAELARQAAAGRTFNKKAP